MKKRIVYARARRLFPKRVIGPLCCVLALFYLGFHAVSGERGFFALFKENRMLAMLKTELAEVVAERQVLDAKVRHLSSNSLDLDLLDERARIVLGMAGKNEAVIFLRDSAK